MNKSKEQKETGKHFESRQSDRSTGALVCSHVWSAAERVVISYSNAPRSHRGGGTLPSPLPGRDSCGAIVFRGFRSGRHGRPALHPRLQSCAPAGSNDHESRARGRMQGLDRRRAVRIHQLSRRMLQSCMTNALRHFLTRLHRMTGHFFAERRPAAIWIH